MYLEEEDDERELDVLITGGAGFLGRHFAHSHIVQGHNVVLVDDFSSGYAFDDLPSEVQKRVTVMDIREWMRTDTTPNWDIVYHFAAPNASRFKSHGDPLYSSLALSIDSEFFHWAWDHTELVVYASGAGVYGTGLKSSVGSGEMSEEMFDPLSESWSTPEDMNGFAKMAGEMLAQSATKYGLHTLCIRPFNVYGEGQSTDYPIPSIARRAVRKQDPLVVWGSGSQARDFIHVSDVVRITRARIDKGVTGFQALNLGTGNPTTIRDIADLCASVMGYAPQIQSDVTMPEGGVSHWSDISRMLKYGSPMVTLREGLARVIEDMR